MTIGIGVPYDDDFLVTCGGCKSEIRLRSTRRAYADAGATDPFEEPRPYADTARTGWKSLGDGYYCPGCFPRMRRAADQWTVARREAIAEELERLQAQLTAQLDAFITAWTAAHPTGVPPSTVRPAVERA